MLSKTKGVVRMTAQTIMIRSRQTIRRWAVDKNVRTAGTVAAYLLGGFLLSGASLDHRALPLAAGLVSALTGWRSAVAALGAALGYRLFWDTAGYQGMVWAWCGCICALFLGKKVVSSDAPLLIPAIMAFAVSATGLLFQLFFRDTTPVWLYLLRIGLGAGTALLYGAFIRQRQPVLLWLVQAASVLALAQIAPLPWLSLGCIAAGLLCVREAFPGAVLAGVALDLAGITPIPMTAVLCAGYLMRMIPWEKRYFSALAPAAGCVLGMLLFGKTDLTPLPGLLIGGFSGVLLPGKTERLHRRGETGIAQVRLEIMAGVMSQTQQILLETAEPEIDENALLHRIRQRACGGCPNRKQCQDVCIPTDSLHRSYADAGSLDFPCRKPGRMILELRRGQEQFKSMKADRARQSQYREAVIQQYQFLSEYLRAQADRLPRGALRHRQVYHPEVAVCSAGKEAANGDRCAWFSGTEGKYYILLCDGMGTGPGAAQEAKTAAELLQKLLSAGFPAEYALRSLNSLTVLRQRGGAVTVDLAEISLDSGWAAVYKWGAAPSWVLRTTGPEKIGTAGPPPGLSVTEARETVERLSLRRGETLILLSDGVDGEGVLRCAKEGGILPPGELAARLLESGASECMDDATAAVVRLSPAALST